MDQDSPTPAKKKGGRIAPPLSERAKQVRSSLESVEVMFRDKLADYEKFLLEDHAGADAIKKEIEALKEIYK